MFRKILCIFITATLLCSCALAMDRETMRLQWAEISKQCDEIPLYQEDPDSENFAPGALTETAQENALACLNFLRALAGLEPAALSPLYSLRAQNGALLLAAHDFLDHYPPQPENMDDALYESALLGTSEGNIAKFNWMRPEILIDGVTYFARDDGDENLADLGHRRWLLNPYMSQTGFGLANSNSGMSYVTMYAVDMGNQDAQWSHVAWPSAGVFPVEFMRKELAWSISLNEDIYNLDLSHPVVTLREESSGASFSFNFSNGENRDGYCTINRDQYGSGPCLIFRPDMDRAGIEEYVQNQLWTVEVSGLVKVDGSQAELRYSCEMTSLYVQEVANIEMSLLEASLMPGEKLQLSALVIPEYADERFLRWSSSDPNVATVDEKGLVTALKSGSCTITATSANGRWDSCAITVKA